MTTPAHARYAGYRFPAEILGHAVWLYFRFSLGPRMVGGMVHYGNIGAADRLDFTVIGPAVNLVSRIENRPMPIVVSAELAAALDGIASFGRHELRGLTAPQELFAPD